MGSGMIAGERYSNINQIFSSMINVFNNAENNKFDGSIYKLVDENINLYSRLDAKKEVGENSTADSIFNLSRYQEKSTQTSVKADGSYKNFSRIVKNFFDGKVSLKFAKK